jgi:hypothetical protein
MTSPATTAREKAEKIVADYELAYTGAVPMHPILVVEITAALLAEREAGKAEGRAEAIAELAGAGRNHAADALAGDKA